MAGLGRGAVRADRWASSRPPLIGIVPSIEFLIGVAVGGRATLLGPVLGAMAVAWARTALSERFPGTWTYLQGLLFVVVVAFLPGGLASLWAAGPPPRRQPRSRPGAGGRRWADDAPSGRRCRRHERRRGWTRLSVRDVRVSFDGFTAVDGVSLDGARR